MLDKKVHSIRYHFQPLIGYRLRRYDTAETCFQNEWYPEPCIPIRLYCGEDRLVSVLWDFDRLLLAADAGIPDSAESNLTRWAANSLKPINFVLGGMLKSVRLGRGQMSVAGREIEVWTRLFIEFDDWWLEIFSGQFGNGYAVLSALPIDDTLMVWLFIGGISCRADLVARSSLGLSEFWRIQLRMHDFARLDRHISPPKVRLDRFRQILRMSSSLAELSLCGRQHCWHAGGPGWFHQWLRKLATRRIRLPTDPNFRPARSTAAWHEAWQRQAQANFRS